MNPKGTFREPCVSVCSLCLTGMQIVSTQVLEFVNAAAKPVR
jgi:hypothetical protein